MRTKQGANERQCKVNYPTLKSREGLQRISIQKKKKQHNKINTDEQRKTPKNVLVKYKILPKRTEQKAKESNKTENYKIPPNEQVKT